MSLRTVSFQDTYWSGENDLIKEFYVPCMEESIEYCRAVGYFNSSILCYITNGLYPFIQNGGRMRIVCSVNLSPEDERQIALGYDIRHLLEDKIDPVTQSLIDLNIANIKNLCWLIKNNRLDIKVCLRKDPNDPGTYHLFHEKFGIFKDADGNAISFLGSVNETLGGWINNEESFEVSQNWIPVLQSRVEQKIQRFERLWDGTAGNIVTFDFPKASRLKLIQNAPEHPVDYIYRVSAGIHPNFKPRSCQEDAKNAFLQKDFSCLFMMATGSGKTKAAMYAISQIDPWKLLLICVPSLELVEQWEADVHLFYPDITIIKCGSPYRGHKELLKSLTQARFPEQVVVISTYDSAQGDFYMAKWRQAKPEQFSMICDEVHNMGAPKSQCLMELNPAYRIGLSATPRRNFDEIGSEKILNFYHQNTFEFSIKDAQREHYLVEYQYRVLPCAMPEEDWESYKAYSKEIVQLQHALEQEDDEKDRLRLQQRIEGRYRDRAKLLKKNDQKVQTLQTIFDEIPPSARVLIYGDDLNHLNELGKELDRMGKYYFKYTGELDAQKERPTILKEFRQGIRKILLAVGCLDEGIDIPACDVAVFISSSTSERQFIQRRGRVLRIAPGKMTAWIYDYLVYPILPASASDEERRMALSMIDAQYRRINLMVDDAINGIREHQKLDQFLSQRKLNPYDF